MTSAPDRQRPFNVDQIMRALVSAYVPFCRGLPVTPPVGGWPAHHVPTCCPIEVMLTQGYLARRREERQGPISVLLHAAFLLGAEQQRRITNREEMS